MTFIVTAFCVDRVTPTTLTRRGTLELPAVTQDSESWARAGYAPGLTRHLRSPVSGIAHYVLVPDEDGWKTSNPLFKYPLDDDEPVRLAVGENYREDFDQVLRELLVASPLHRVILVAEYNGGVTSPDLDDESAETVDVLGPMRLSEFWRRHDLGDIMEDSITILQE